MAESKSSGVYSEIFFINRPLLSHDKGLFSLDDVVNNFDTMHDTHTHTVLTL